MQRRTQTIKMENKKRYGSTKVTSVSLSPLFAQFLEQYDISPTEAIRKGIAVHLCDLGAGQYQSAKNEERAKFVRDFVKRVEEDEQLRKEFNKVEKFLEIRKKMREIKKIIGDLDGDNLNKKEDLKNG